MFSCFSHRYHGWGFTYPWNSSRKHGWLHMQGHERRLTRRIYHRAHCQM